MAQSLRKHFVFTIIPMLNPDGVAEGNYRTSLSGVDLNRTWDGPSPSSHQEIHAAKALLKRLQDQQGVEMFVDLHGHSVKKDNFIYGYEGGPAGHEVWVLPFILGEEVRGERLDDMFSYRSSRFNKVTSQAFKKIYDRTFLSRPMDCL